MKKILALLLVALLVTSLVACSKTGKGDNSTDSSGKSTNGSNGEILAPKEDDTKIEELLNSYWHYRYMGVEDRYADGYGALKSSETNEDGVVVKRFYTWRSVEYNPAENTLILRSLSTDGTEEEGSESIVKFNEKNQPLSGGGTFKYDENGNLIERKSGRITYTYEYSADKKTVTQYNNGNLRYVYKYDDNGYLIGLTMYDDNGDWSTGIVYENDDQGRRLKTYSADKNGNIGSTMETRTYDEQGNLASLHN